MITGIFGPIQSGKTTLARAPSVEIYRAERRRSIVFDPNAENWGGHAAVFTDSALFQKTVWRSQNCEIFADEAAVTVARDRDNMPLFTRVRHFGHRLTVIGHSGGDLLPGMRQQFTRLFLFRQPASAADVWAELFADGRILACADLAQFEFLDCRLYAAPVRSRLRI